MLTTLFLGFSSGLPLLATGSTLQAWMTEQKVDLKLIGIFALVKSPYSFKFLWAPLLDRYVPPFLGRRRGWMLITQLLLIASFCALGSTDPVSSPWLTALFAVCVAFCSASQDIVLDAHRREILREDELGLGSALFVNGYRIGMIVAGAVALAMAERIHWPEVYFFLGGCMLVGIVTTLLCEEPANITPPRTLQHAVVEPFQEFFRRKEAFDLLIFIVLYKLGEMLASSMTMPFMLGIGFSKIEIAETAKAFGLVATILGGLSGGIVMLRLGVNRSLWMFGVLQAVGIFGFSLLAVVGHDMWLLAGVVAFENFTSGMATTAFLAFLAKLCNKQYSATQYALLSSFMSLPGIYLGAVSGLLAAQFGWFNYFVFCACVTVPGILLLTKVAPWHGSTDSQRTA